MSDDSTRQEFLTELESVLESDEAYGSNIQVLTYSVKDDVINGKFKDSWNNRVYEFIIDINGISYKPAVNLDSFLADEAPVRFDSYSEGYASLFKDARLDGKLTGKRVKKPKCGKGGYGCGFSCIGLVKICRILGSGKEAGTNQGRAIGKERLIKLANLARKLNSEGETTKAKTVYLQAKSIKEARDKHKSRGNERKAERVSQVSNEVKEINNLSNTNNNQVLGNKEFKTIGNAETREKLKKQWKEMNTELNELSERRRAKGIDKKRIRAATEIIGSLFDMSEYEEYNFNGIVDNKGNLQAAYISHETEKGYYVDYLASAPWNSLESHPKKKTGAGASAMEAIVKTAISKDKGQIELESTRNAVPFYEKVGFKRQKGGTQDYPIMTLDKESGKQFLINQEKKNRQDTSLFTQNSNLTELEQLEEQALGLFTIPQSIHKKVIEKIESSQG